MEKEIELLPCPFCGKNSGKARHPGWNSYHCSDVQCDGHDLYAEVFQWNRRDREARLVEALEQEVYRLNNHDMHLDISFVAANAEVPCPVCEACTRIWAIIHPEDADIKPQDRGEK